MTDSANMVARLPEPTPSPVRVLFSSTLRAASWTIRGEQIAGCRTNWVARHEVEDAELATYDVLCLVKRFDPELVRRARRRGIPVVFDVLDSWAQPDDGLRCCDRPAAVDLFRAMWKPLRLDALIFPNRTMREHLGGLTVASTFIYHHYLPGLDVAPWREHPKTVGYVGSERYLGPWREVLERVCDQVGLTLSINPRSFADLDLGVCVRGGEHDSFLANHYKSNVKLANFYGAGIPALAGVKELSCHETDNGYVHFFADEAQLRAQLERLLEPAWRRTVRERFIETREQFRIERMADAYESFFTEVVRRRRPGRKPRHREERGLIRRWTAGMQERVREVPAFLHWARTLPEENARLARSLRDERIEAKALKARARELNARIGQLTTELREARAVAPADVIRRFHELFYDRGAWKSGAWAGVPILKNPLDLFLYQELIFRRRPRFIVELGANQGGSTLFFAHMLDLVGGDAKVLSVSIDDAWAEQVRAHPRVEVFAGSSTDPAIVREVVRRVSSAGGGCLVNLDSDHGRDHVLAELRAYGDLPGPGDYLLVEDGNVNGHPVRLDHGPGPLEAIEEFLASDDRYEPDVALEGRYLFTFAVKGFLRRRAT